jgi:hypothetical protein
VGRKAVEEKVERKPRKGAQQPLPSTGLQPRTAAQAAAPEPAPAAENPEAMTKENRQRWLNRMFALLNDGDCTDRDDQLIVLSYLAGRDSADMLEHRDQLSDKELRDVVTMLHAYNKNGELGGTITEILNTHTLTTETGTAATTPEAQAARGGDGPW